MKYLIPDPSIELGYEYQTTFWLDFDIADRFGLNAVIDTYRKEFQLAKLNYIWLTELCLVLNWRVWGWFNNHNIELSQLYEKLFYEIDDYALNNLDGPELDYFLQTTD